MKYLKIIYKGSKLFWIVILLLTLFGGNPKNPSIDDFDFLNHTHVYTDYINMIRVQLNLEDYKINLFE